MTAQSIDPERLAALLEGRLDAAARAQVIDALEASPELRAIYADVIAVAQVGGDARTASSSLAERRRRFVPMSIAATLLIAVTSFGIWHSWHGRELPPPQAILGLFNTRGGAQHPSVPPDAWGAFRGGDELVSATGRAVRIGAAIADLELAVDARDSVGWAARRIAVLLEGFPGGELAASPYSRIAEQPTVLPSPGQLRQAADSAELLVHRRPLRLGAWLELARAAAMQRDSSFFMSPATRDALSSLRITTVGQSDAEPIVDQLAEAIAGRPTDFGAINARLLELLQKSGR